MLDWGAALLRRLPAETAHRTTVSMLERAAPFIRAAPPDDPRLAVSALGLHFPNPIGLAAGFDKDARMPQAMLKLGFGFVECGTITPHPQSGNPRPRLFRLAEDGAVINRMGFNNAGAARAAERLKMRQRNGVLGINIGANKDSKDRIADYREGFAVLAPVADYIAVNVSSPNTAGLRDLQARNELTRLLDVVISERAAQNARVPILVKIAPDISLSDLDQVTETALTLGIEGLIVSNTTTERPHTLRSRHARETGGLSGAPLFVPSTALLKETYRRVGAKLVLIGVGGIFSGADAYAKIRAGATLLQLYTALTLTGPALVERIKTELVGLMEKDGITNIADALGNDLQGMARS
ncbi:MAG TPA: quinone-dependent dihydroorotate dehydrogenase [Rhizomicrobium sp.]|jgi:dihydroorotate dehydrogenase|nr:quinone-dependent dihydroorotate dehydrogenase [Rhizomicrobium sp.]